MTSLVTDYLLLQGPAGLQGANSNPSPAPQSVPGPQPRLDITRLDPIVQFYCYSGLADSTRKTYQVGVNRYSQFCNSYSAVPFPVSESLLCYFVATLAQQGLAPATIRTYLAGVRHAQIMRGYEEPHHNSSLPRLHLLQAGVRRVRAHQGIPQARTRLPILPTHLRQIRAIWNTSSDPDVSMWWAAVTTAFFGFFRLGEITVPSATAFDSRVHLCWGDVAVDSTESPTVIRIHLKFSKCDQFGQGVQVFLAGRTMNCVRWWLF